MRGAPTTRSPALEARRCRGRWPDAFSATNDVSMNASFVVEVQSNVRELVSIESDSFFGAYLKGVAPKRSNQCVAETGERQARQQLGREIFSGVQFRDRSAKFYRVFKATDSSTGPRVRIPLGPPASPLFFQRNFAIRNCHHSSVLSSNAARGQPAKWRSWIRSRVTPITTHLGLRPASEDKRSRNRLIQPLNRAAVHEVYG